MNKDLKNKINNFSVSLNEEQKKELDQIIYLVPAAKTETLNIKDFRNYAMEIASFKFIYKLKEPDITNQIKKFFIDFFLLINPTIQQELLNFEVKVHCGKIEIKELNELTISMFDTIICVKR